jgi:hypothetical protein
MTDPARKTRPCVCGPESRGPHRGYCGGCGGYIADKDEARDERWRQAMVEIRARGMWNEVGPATVLGVRCSVCGGLEIDGACRRCYEIERRARAMVPPPVRSFEYGPYEMALEKAREQVRAEMEKR